MGRQAGAASPLVPQTTTSRLPYLSCHVCCRHCLSAAAEGGAYGWAGGDRLQLEWRTPLQHLHLGDPAEDSDDKTDFICNVAHRVEQLLYLAYKLDLPPLQERLLGFVAGCCQTDSGLLYGSLGMIFTDHILQEAVQAGSALHSRQWVSSVLTQPAGLLPRRFHIHQLLQPLEFQHPEEDSPGSPPYPGCSPYSSYLYRRHTSRLKPGEPPKDVCFRARLTRAFMGAAAGEEVPVELNVFEGRARMGHVDCTAQLLLGPHMCDAADFSRVMHGGAREGPAQEAQQQEGGGDDD